MHPNFYFILFFYLYLYLTAFLMYSFAKCLVTVYSDYEYPAPCNSLILLGDAQANLMNTTFRNMNFSEFQWELILE